MKKSNPIALLPIGVFLVIYLGLGLLFKYGLKINMGFYNIPIVVAFLIALLVACLQNRELSFDAKLELMGHTSTEMLRHYQHTNYADLRKITDNL